MAISTATEELEIEGYKKLIWMWIAPPPLLNFWASFPGKLACFLQILVGRDMLL